MMPPSEPPQEDSEIPPFWQRLPRFFLYPLHFDPLLHLFFLAAAALLGYIVPLPAPLDFLVVFLGIMLAFIRYAYKILDQAAMGLTEPDDFALSEDSSRVNLPYKLFGVFIVIGVFADFAGELAGGLAIGAVMIYVTLAVPAIMMTLAVTRSFLAALNPLAVIRMMGVVGWPYLGLVAFVFLLEASQAAAGAFLLPLIPEWLVPSAAVFITLYFSLILFNMMGYVIYQHHDALGVRTRPSGRGAAGSAGSGETESYADLIAAGEIDKALDRAYEEQRTDPDNAGAHERYHKLLLLAAGQEHRLLSHARRYLVVLLKKERPAEAIALFHAMRERDPAFEPDEPAHILRLAEAARKTRDFKLALSIVKGFDKRFRGSAEIPAVYFFAAQTLSENLRQDAAARQILAALLERYPTSPVSDKARQLLDVIEKMAAH